MPLPAVLLLLLVMVAVVATQSCAFPISSCSSIVNPKLFRHGWQQQVVVVQQVSLPSRTEARRLSVLRASSSSGEQHHDNNNDDDPSTVHNKNEDSNNISSKSALGRAGGRSRRQSHPSRSMKESIVPIMAVPVSILFALLLSLQPFFFLGTTSIEKSSSDSSSASYYYFESSVYERRVYNPDGSIHQTSRKESIQTNVPSLLEGKRLFLEDNDRSLRRQGYSRPSIEHDDF